MIEKLNPGIIIVLFGLLFFTVGFFQSGYHDTLMKAIYICLECIGIG